MNASNPATNPIELPVSPDVRKAFAPTGVLRATINLGNPILARAVDTAERVSGVSVDLARALAASLALPLELVVLKTAGEAVDIVTKGDADVGFFAIDPVRGAGIGFTAAYVLIEGFYLVREGSPVRDNAQVDRPGTRVMVGKGSAYDLYLSRELKHATIERAVSSPAVFDTYVAQSADVAAGVKQQLESDAKRVPGHRLLSQRFMVIQQAMGCPKSRGDEVRSHLSRFVEVAKASGFVARSLSTHGIEGASVAPAV